MSSYPVYEYSMNDVARAGQRLKDVIAWDDYDDEVRRVFAVANSWRDSHVLPMKSIRLSIAHRMRHMKLSGDVVARAKRMSSIRGKLRRHPGKLDQMQDLGGCRAIMDDISGVHAMVAECLHRMPHDVRNHKNYVDNAKPDGYRSHHLIFKFEGDGDRAVYRGRRVELQIRTKLQHSWATAVEVVGQTRLEELKSGKGSAEWLRFFRLMSDEFSFQEGCELDRVAPDRRHRIAEIRDCNNALRAMDVLENHRTTTRYIASYILSGDARVFLIRYDNINHTVSVEGYSDPSVGALALQHEEMSMEEAGLTENSAVLVDAKEAASIVSAFPNYFGDVSLFLGRLKTICGKAGDAEYELPKQETAPSRPHEVPDLSWFKQRHRRWTEGGKGKNK
ncbi:RelA/SpoT domain-containing protein [Rhizobium sp. N541]|uniref:RelA/SpoT domain-containing protein n=1 Tax=unclassified Rhizobium TaxID=2613769 RepID=UPI0007EE3F7A|nr:MULTISPECIES: RelA/SpoT domain-containing protein [unclassified Rhizobium]ANM16905.1 RelA/SpoT domain-containing protein [Rhizobium sp. N541]ANM23290.1 RelA/SpoT domain-containing protein [Rhizobium sp. N941]